MLSPFDFSHVQEGDVVYIQGPRGSGKTSIAEQIQHELGIHDAYTNPSYLELSSFKQEQIEATNDENEHPEPLLLIFDEPTENLNSPIMEWVIKNGKYCGITTIIITQTFQPIHQHLLDLIICLKIGKEAHACYFSQCTKAPNMIWYKKKVFTLGQIMV